MHILVISDVYFPRVNGVSTSIQSFRKQLRLLGHRVTLIAPDYGELLDDEEDIIRIPSRVVIIDKEDRMMKRRSLRKMIKKLDLNQFDLVHIQTPFIAHYEGIRIARQARLKVVTTYHTFFEEYFYLYVKWLPRELTRFLARSFSRQQCKQYDGIIVPSTPMQEVLIRYGINIKTHKIPTGIQLHPKEYLKHSQISYFRIKHNIPDGRPILLFVGRVAFEKNIEFLLDVASELNNRDFPFTLVIAGEGPAEQSLKNRMKQLGLANQTRFLGYLERFTELQVCYQEADLFIFASRTETQGLVLLEAMAHGTPVVSTAVMGTKDVMGDNRGGLIAEENPELFADNVQRLLCDEALYAERSKDALNYARQWSETAMTHKLVNFYTELLNRD